MFRSRFVFVLLASFFWLPFVSQAEELRVLRILSYNIHHAEGIDRKLDLPRIAKVIQSVNPDLVALQEVDRNTRRTGNVDQAAELGRLTGMHVVFGDNIEFEGGQYGNAILSKSAPDKTQNHLLPCFEQGEQRGVLEARFTLSDQGPPLILFATHLDHRRDDRERIASAKQINELLAQRKGSPAILAGDLNDTPESDTLQILSEHWKRANEEPAATIPVTKPQRQIDFVMLHPRDRWNVKSTKVLDEAVASDHRAILAVAELKLADSESNSEKD